MLKLRDFLHLPELDALMERVVRDGEGLIILAGIDARPDLARSSSETLSPSGLSAIFNILIQEILLAHPRDEAMVIASERSLARVPRAIARRVRFIPVSEPGEYEEQIKAARRLKPGLLVIDHLTKESLPAALQAANSGLRVLSQLGTVLRGAAVVRQLVEMGAERGHLAGLRWVLTTQRMQVLCQKCRRPVSLSSEEAAALAARWPRLIPLLDAAKDAQEHASFARAGACAECRQSGYEGDMAVFDLYQHPPEANDEAVKGSLLSLEEYVLRLAAQGKIDLDDLLDLEGNHLRRTYRMLADSEQALSSANIELKRRIVEIEASNRVLVQRTEALISLQDLGQALISSTDLRDLAGKVCRKAGDLCGADRVVLYLRREHDGQETAEVVGVRGWEPSAVGRTVPPAQVFDAVMHGKTLRFLHFPPGVRPEQPPPGGVVSGASQAALLLSNGLRVPLIAQDQLVGVMIVQSTDRTSFRPGEGALLQTFANQAALAFQRAGLVEELRAKITELEAAQASLVKKERMERELELAREVQRDLLPRSFPDVPGFSFVARYEPARQVGGDFYDAFRLDSDHFGVVIADVSDKGMPAALYMALTRSLLLAEARREPSPRRTLMNVNQLLLEIGDLNGFVSVFYGVVTCSTQSLAYTRAGHEKPLLMRGSQVTALDGTGTVLGVMDGDQLNLSEETMALRKGDRLVLFTDGLCDVINEQGKFFGQASLRSLLIERKDVDAADLCDSIFDALETYRGTAEPFDDMTLVTLAVQ